MRRILTLKLAKLEINRTFVWVFASGMVSGFMLRPLLVGAWQILKPVVHRWVA